MRNYSAATVVLLLGWSVFSGCGRMDANRPTDTKRSADASVPAPIQPPELVAGTVCYALDYISVPQPFGITSIVPGTRLTVVALSHDKLRVSDGAREFDAVRGQVTSELNAVRQRGAGGARDPSRRSQQHATASKVIMPVPTTDFVEPARVMARPTPNPLDRGAYDGRTVTSAPVVGWPYRQ